MPGQELAPIAPIQIKNLPAKFAKYLDPKNYKGDLTHGVVSGFAVMSIRGTKWRVKYQGEERLIEDEEGENKSYIDAVILKTAKYISKIYYETAYEEGSDQAPTCASSNGIQPDDGVLDPQSATCATCPHNVWGSRITPGGKKTRECGDSRRIAIVPHNDITNEPLGGPMLLRVPAASLAALETYGKLYERVGVPYNQYVTRFSFDGDASYPKIVFRRGDQLSGEDYIKVLEHLEEYDSISQVLNEAFDFEEEEEAKTQATAQTLIYDDETDQLKTTEGKVVSEEEVEQKVETNDGADLPIEVEAEQKEKPKKATAKRGKLKAIETPEEAPPVATAEDGEGVEDEVVDIMGALDSKGNAGDELSDIPF